MLISDLARAMELVDGFVARLSTHMAGAGTRELASKATIAGQCIVAEWKSGQVT